MASAELSSAHRYAAGGLFALALRQAQLQQNYSQAGFGFPPVIDPPEVGGESEKDGVLPWSLEKSGLVRHVFRYLGIDGKDWAGLESNSMSTEVKHHISSFLKLLAEDDEESRKLAEDEASLAKAVDAAVKSAKEKQQDSIPSSKMTEGPRSELREMAKQKDMTWDLSELANTVSKERKVAVVYTLLAACVSDPVSEEPKGKKDKNAGGNSDGADIVIKPGYDARQRVALRLLALWFDIEWVKVATMELMVAYMAMAAQKEMEQNYDKDAEKKSRWKKWKRGGMIGAAALTGGALLVVTGGLAAPAIAAGLEAVGAAVPILGAGGLTAAAAVAGSGAVGSTAVAASFGAAGAGLSGKKMARRTGDIDEFEFVKLGDNHQQGRLAVEIVVSGIAFHSDDFVKPWEAADGDLERYALRWESEVVYAVSTAIQDQLKSTATQQAIKQGAMYTVLGGLVSAMATPLMAFGATNLIDSKWGMAIDRSEKAGKLLATVLLQGNQGNRPVTLIGFALGARIIFTCLEELAKHGDEGLGIVERVLLLGTPQTLDKAKWESVRKVVAGRFVNGFSKNDWVLGVVYRANFMTHGLAGLQAVDIPGIENVDLTEVVDGHTSYLTSLKHILHGVDLDGFYATQSHKLQMSDEDKKKAESTPAGPAE
ncbi:hypothetical protein M758_3G044400 [Ceratodon purpureus]|nr:hypothetical protein M758_3G044400 [Ceratodon purpureus]